MEGRGIGTYTNRKEQEEGDTEVKGGEKKDRRE
jgi:hypothetical protein